MRVLLTGARGLLGAAIAREFHGEAVTAFDHEQLDVTDADTVRAAVDRLEPDLIVNCAAYNNVDEAESQAARALDVNAFAVLTLAQAARARGATLVHYSSDFVFDGEADRPYTEDDRPAPRSVYAASKLLGDWFALEMTRAYVLRVESLFGRPGPGGARVGSLGTIVQRLSRGEDVPVFVDRTVSPSSTADVAAATRALVESRRAGRPLPLRECRCGDLGPDRRLRGGDPRGPFAHQAPDARNRDARREAAALLRALECEARGCRHRHADLAGRAAALSVLVTLVGRA